MIPPDLLMAIAGTREKVPFPSIVEILMMELAFELIREAGLRVPCPYWSNHWDCRCFNRRPSCCTSQYD